MSERHFHFDATFPLEFRWKTPILSILFLGRCSYVFVSFLCIVNLKLTTLKKSDIFIHCANRKKLKGWLITRLIMFGVVWLTLYLSLSLLLLLCVWMAFELIMRSDKNIILRTICWHWNGLLYHMFIYLFEFQYKHSTELWNEWKWKQQQKKCAKTNFVRFSLKFILFIISTCLTVCLQLFCVCLYVFVNVSRSHLVAWMLFLLDHNHLIWYVDRYRDHSQPP